ncbi:MAG: chain-length determining protein [Prevotella sp.]|nr:chain-length determining protein [Prevotella sp.]
MADKNTNTKIDLKKMWATIRSNKKLFLKVWIITFVLACLWILPQPRYYTTTVSIAPETGEMKVGGSLASLASNFGMNLGNSSSTGDAIYPQLYPDLFKSTEFLVGLLDVTVTTKDGELTTDYYTYMKDHQKQNWLLLPLLKLKNWFHSLFTVEDTSDTCKAGKRFDPFQLSKKTHEILMNVSGKLKCTYSRTNEVVTITVTDQDPLVCALMADSVKQHLQLFITDYRTKKARSDCRHYEKLKKEAWEDYEKARNEYTSYCDANSDAVLESVKMKITDLENEMQLKYSVYTGMNTHLESARAKLQERIPAFTTLLNSTVPVKPDGPKRMIFVAIMLFLATMGTIVYAFHKELIDWF